MSNTLVANHRFDTLAMMLVEGWQTEDICEAMSLGADVVMKYARGDGPKEFTKILEGYRGKIFHQAVQRKFRFAEHAEKAYRNIGKSLDSTDDKFAVEQSWKVLNEVSKAPEPTQAPGVSVTLTQNTQVNAQIAELGINLIQSMKDLKKASIPNFNKHIQEGTAALPEAMQRAQEAKEREDELAENEILEAEVVEVGEGMPKPDRNPLTNTE